MDENSVSGELTIRSQGESVHLPDIPQPVISALHQAAIGVKDHIETFKYRLIAIKIEDIRQVYEMLAQWTRQYNIQSQVTQIIAEHRHAETGATTSRRVFRSIEDFFRYDDSNIDPVKLLTVKFSFILKNPNTNRLESYDITLEFPESADWRQDLLTGDKSSDPFHFVYRGTDTWTLKVRIEYSDYVTAVALQSMITSWYTTLDGKGREWISRKIRFYERLLHHSPFSIFSPGAFISKWLPPIFSFSISSSFWSAAEIWFGSTKAWLFTGILFLLVYMVMDYAVTQLIAKSGRGASSSSRTPILLLNAGNRKIYEAERESVIRSRDRSRSMGKLLFGSILLSMAVSIAANYVTYLLW